MQRHTHTHAHKILQPSAGVMIVVPSACLTKTLTQQLVVYSFALDNRMCSSIRPQITQSVKIRSLLSLPPSLPLGGCVCGSLTAHREEEWRGKEEKRGDEGLEQEIEGDRETRPDKEEEYSDPCLKIETIKHT